MPKAELIHQVAIAQLENLMMVQIMMIVSLVQFNVTLVLELQLIVDNVLETELIHITVNVLHIHWNKELLPAQPVTQFVILA